MENNERKHEENKLDELTENEIKLCMEEFIAKTEVVISNLKLKHEEIEAHDYKVNLAKTVGTSVSSVATLLTVGGLLAAPFTMGTSLIVSGVAGSVAVLGGLTNLGTEIADMTISKDFIGQINKIGEERNLIANKLQEYLTEIDHVAIELKKSGIDEETSLALALNYAKFAYRIAIKGKDTISIVKRIIDSYRLAKITATSIEMTIAGTGKILAFGFIKGFKLNNIGTLGLIMSKFGVLGKTAAKMLPGLSIVFSVIDIVSLAKSWKDKNPTLNALTEVIDKLEQELLEIKQLYDFFKNDEIVEI